MAALKTTVVLFLLLMAGAATYLSVGADRMAGEPFHMVAVDPGEFEKQIAAAIAAEKEQQRQQQLAAQAAQEQQMLQQQKAQAAAGGGALEMTAQTSPIPGGDLPVTGQRPPSLKIDPNAGVTVTDIQ